MVSGPTVPMTTERRADGTLVHTFADTPAGRDALRRLLLDRFGSVVEYRAKGFGVELRKPEDKADAE